MISRGNHGREIAVVGEGVGEGVGGALYPKAASTTVASQHRWVESTWGSLGLRMCLRMGNAFCYRRREVFSPHPVRASSKLKFPTSPSGKCPSQDLWPSLLGPEGGCPGGGGGGGDYKSEVTLLPVTSSTQVSNVNSLPGQNPDLRATAATETFLWMEV